MAELDDDIPLTDEELALAQRGATLVAAAMAHPEARAPRALHDALERVGTTGRGRTAEPAGTIERGRTAEPAATAAGARAAGRAHDAEPAPRRRGLGLPRAPRAAGRRPRRWLVAPGLGFACVLVLAFMLVLRGHDPAAGRPSVLDVAAVTRLPAREAAPARVAGRSPHLSAAVDGLAFPDWSAAFDWKTTGRRMDRVGGRAVTTVFYRYQDGSTLGYAIVAGAPLRSPAGRDVVRRGVRYRIVKRNGRTTVTWTQSGHTCVLDASSRVPAAELVALADWANT
ncbi:MAG TPA: hypothetical protein VHZ31_02115 [Solirubrobacteraceae bacterium]|jgi:hypothetical protein|nr:hypothetical protein [Solirubrobacteraceae bacterium]